MRSQGCNRVPAAAASGSCSGDPPSCASLPSTCGLPPPHAHACPPHEPNHGVFTLHRRLAPFWYPFPLCFLSECAVSTLTRGRVRNHAGVPARRRPPPLAPLSRHIRSYQPVTGQRCSRVHNLPPSFPPLLLAGAAQLTLAAAADVPAPHCFPVHIRGARLSRE